MGGVGSTSHEPSPLPPTLTSLGGGDDVLEFPGVRSKRRKCSRNVPGGAWGSAAVLKGGAGWASTGGCPGPPATFSSAPSALGPSACEKLLPFGLGSLDPKAPFPCPRHEAWSPRAVQDPCPTPAFLLPAPWKPHREGCWWPPAPRPPPWEVLLLAILTNACPRPRLALRPHLTSGQQLWERGQAGSGTLGWWAQGEGYKWPPPGWAPAQKGHGALLRPMGAQGPPHLPRLPGPAQPRAAVQSKKSWRGGTEVGLLYLGISDEFRKTPGSRSQGAWPGCGGVQGSRVSGGPGPIWCYIGVHTAVPPGDRRPPLLQLTVPSQPSRRLSHELAGPPLLQAGRGLQQWWGSLGWGCPPLGGILSSQALSGTGAGGARDVLPCQGRPA